MNLLRAFRNVPKIGYLAGFITFCMSAGHFMSLPFLAIYLAQQNLFTPGQIGIVLGISGLMYSATSLLSGLYLDRSSPKKNIIIALFICGICYASFAFSMQHFFILLLINAILGWMRSFVQIAVLSVLVAHTKPENLSSAYSARFIGANLGVVFGPLIGGLMAVHQSLFIFYIAGALHIFLGIIMFFYTDKKVHSETPMKLKSGFTELFKDKLLLKLTLINLLLWTAYVQIDTTIPQYLASAWNNPAMLFSIMMMINAGICVLFQPFIMRWSELNSQKISGIFGSFLFAVAFIFLFFPISTTFMVASVVLMSFGELFTMPINSVLVMRIAPKHLLSSYNGFYNMGQLGFSLGPFLGGYGLQYIGGQYTFLLSCLLPVIAGWIYYKSIMD